MTRILYPIKAEPVLTDAQRPEQVTESRWHQPFSDPVLRRGLIAAVIAASGAIGPVLTDTQTPEQVTESRWHQPFSVPVLRGGLTAAATAASGSFYTPPADPITLDKWYPPLAEPVRRKPTVHPAALTWSYFTPAGVSVHGWNRPLSVPVRRKPAVQPDALSWGYHTPPVVTVATWYQPLSQPVRLGSGVQGSFLQSVPLVDPASIGLWQQPTSQPTLRTPTVQPDALTWTATEIVTLDKWQSAFALPLFSRGFAASSQLSLAFVPVVETVETPGPPGSGRRRGYGPEPAYDVEPAKRFQPIWDKVRAEKIRARNRELAERQAAPVPLPPPDPNFRRRATPPAPPSLAQYAPRDPMGLERRLRDAKDLTDISGALEVLKAVGLIET